MKQIFFLPAFLIFIVTCYGQVPNSSKDYFLEKGKNQKTAAWIMLTGGTAVAITGFVLANKQIDNDDPLNLDNLETGGGFAILGIVGIGSALASIPFFISSAKNKRRAAAISFKNQRMLLPMQSAFVLKTQPAFTLKIEL